MVKSSSTIKKQTESVIFRFNSIQKCFISTILKFIKTFEINIENVNCAVIHICFTLIDFLSLVKQVTPFCRISKYEYVQLKYDPLKVKYSHSFSIPTVN